MATLNRMPTPQLPKYEARLQQSLKQASGRLRWNDLAIGLFLLLSMGFAFLVTMILLDRYFELSNGIRQTAWLGFLALALFVGYRQMVRPFRRTINPRYAARQIESTSKTNRNELINWVDLQEQELPTGVRSAVSSRAAESIAHVNVSQAMESRRVLWLGGVAGLLFAILALMFVLFRPTPFLSLLNRTLNPFESTAIASRTELTIVQPEEPDITLTNGVSAIIAVHVSGSVPEEDSPEKVRLQIRYNPEANFDDLPMEQGTSNREWNITLPPSLIQNGLWYRVVGGDAATPEYRITVRTRPLILNFATKYDYPEYTRLAPERSTGPDIEAYRGTQVVHSITTNRDVKSGRLRLSEETQPIEGTVATDDATRLEFRFPLTKTQTYRVDYTTAQGERSELSPAYRINVLADNAPNVEIVQPTEENVTLPLNGLLKVDGFASDDFGITTSTLVVRVPGSAEPLLRKPYLEGKDLLRESDNSYPTRLETKDSVPIAELLKLDPSLKVGSIIEYWLEAEDNCTEPKPNVGSSAIQRVTLEAIPEEPEQKQAIEHGKTERGQLEEKHRQEQTEKFKNEDRTPQQPRPEQAEPQQGEEPQDNDAKPEESQPSETGEPGADAQPSENGTPGEQEPKAGTEPEQQPEPGSDASGDGSTDKTIEQEADKVEDALNELNQQPGQGRGSPENDEAEVPPAEPKDAPQENAEPTNEPKPEENDTENAGTSKEAGKTESNDSQGKEQPKDASDSASSPMDKPKPGDGDSTKSKSVPEQSDAAEPKEAPEQGNSTSKPEAGEKRGDAKPSDNGMSQPGTAKGEQPQQPGESKPQPKDDTSTLENSAQPKEAPSEGQPGESKPNDGQNSDSFGNQKPQPGELEREFGKDGEPEPPRDSKPGDVERLVRDKAEEIANGNEQTREQAKQDLADQLGQENADEISKKAEGLNSKNPEERQKAEEDIDELAKKNEEEQLQKKQQDNDNGQQGNSNQPTQEQMEEFSKAAKDLNSDDPQTKADAQKKIDDMIGQENRKKAEQLSKDLQSADKQTRENAQKQVQEMAEQLKQQQAKADQKNLEQAAKDMAGNDESKKDQAGQTIDKHLGEENRAKAKELGEQLKNGSPKEQQAAKEELQQMAKDAQQQQSGQPSEADKQEIQDAVEKLANGNEAQKQEARDTLDKKIGKENRENAENKANELVDKLQNGSAEEKEAAAKEIEQMAKDAQKNQQNGSGSSPQPKELTAQEKQELQEDAKKLANGTPEEKEAARKRIDDKIGKENREKAEDLADKLQNGSAEDKEAAKKQLEQMAKEMKEQQQNAGQKPSKQKMDEMKEAAKNLHSDDPKEQQAAKDKLDKEIGPENRKKLEEQTKGTNPNDSEQEKKTEQELAKMSNDKQNSGGAEGQQPDMAKLQEKMKDLTSNNDAEREAAEQAFDKAMGPEEREKMQDLMRDLQSDDKQMQQSAQQKVEEMMDQLEKMNPNGRGNGGPEEKVLEADPKNRLKAAQLQLEKFEKNKENEALRNKLDYSKEEYEQFLEGMRKRVESLENEVAIAAEPEEPKRNRDAPTTIKVGSAGQRETRDGGIEINGGTGVGVAPKGYSEAKQKFAAEIAKQRRKKK